MMDYLPQPYLLWCAEFAIDTTGIGPYLGEVAVGLVVAWRQLDQSDPARAQGWYLVPVVAWSNAAGALRDVDDVAVGPYVAEDEQPPPVFLALTADEAVQKAETYRVWFTTEREAQP